jgi:glutathione reductase (NADPH)
VRDRPPRFQRPPRNSEFDADLFMIGAGQEAFALHVASGHGATVIFAEEYRLGGTCVISGCVLKKLFVYARLSAHVRRRRGIRLALVGPAFRLIVIGRRKRPRDHTPERAPRHWSRKCGRRGVRSRAVLEDAHTLRLLKTAIM